MTIRRRLFISNILMLVLPIVISVLLLAFMVVAAMGILGWRPHSVHNDIYDVMDEIDDYMEGRTDYIDLDEITGYIDRYADDIESLGVALAVYEDDEPVYSIGQMQEGALMDMAMAAEGKHSYTMDETEIYTSDFGEYFLVVSGSSSGAMERLYDTNTFKRLQNLFVLVVVVIVAVVVLINRLLTRMIINRILNPLDTLVYGVHQIRDGNLDYRINYSGKDEFAAVCDDFNEMAQRLMDMVNARQKDDENRRELIAGMSHDLRTPLTSIKAYVEGLEKGVATTHRLRSQYLETIRNKTEDLEHIVAQLFLFSKIDVGDFSLRNKPEDIGAELEKYIEGVAAEYADKGLEIRLDENTHGLMANVDIVQLRSVYTNLLENTVKYGGQSRAVGQPLTMGVSCRGEGDSVVITWEDNGPGVPEQVLERIFDVFYRGDKARSNTSQGSGLGLAISAKLMALMGGEISAENIDGDGQSGLRITLKLPAIKG